jgi:copper chaperone NosL
MKYYHPFFLIFSLFLTSCAVEPQPINYGTDACHFCKMNIVDSQHAAEFVTSKGKAYKFDAIECMLNQTKDFDKAAIELFLICDYSVPGKLTDATTATYLISESIPSPMGGFLSGFASDTKAVSVHSEVEGQLYSWEQLKAKYDL